ncbi:MAG: hypothetical protein MHM6MM_002732 [Cercozoa sp. M6MM]
MSGASLVLLIAVVRNFVLVVLLIQANTDIWNLWSSVMRRPAQSLERIKRSLKQHGTEVVLSSDFVLKCFMRILDTTEDCAICLQKWRPYDKVQVLPCAHAFHSTCILRWLKRRPQCPLCLHMVAHAAPTARSQSQLLVLRANVGHDARTDTNRSSNDRGNHSD